LKNLRTRFDRFCYRNRNKGIPNLMLYIALGNAFVVLLSMFNGGSQLLGLLCFDKASILKGQVWRLFTYVFTQSTTSPLGLLYLYIYYLLGRSVEQMMGTFRFNLHYLSGVLLMDIFAMIFAPVLSDQFTQEQAMAALVYINMANYLHLSLLLSFATAHPDSQFLIFFIIPIKAWVIGLVYLVLTAVDIFNLSYPVLFFPHNLLPLVALANYLLFAGSDIRNLLPPSWRVRRVKPIKAKTNAEPIPFRTQRAETPNYNHRCTICGRTDVSHPDLEFRYCSRCQGYHCYCEDHIGNHTHIQ